MKNPIAPFSVCAIGFFFAAGCSKKTPAPSGVVVAPPLAVQVNPPRPADKDPLARGLWWLYQLQYEKARDEFARYAREHPADPAGPFYQTATDWWQLAQDFELLQPDIVARFKQDSDQTIRIAQKLEKSKLGSDRARAYLFEGGAWGLRGRLEVTRRHWLDAYRAGKRGHSFLEKAIKLDPHLDDAYLGLGIYDYYSATLKGAQAVLSKLLMHGDKTRGMNEIRRAKEKGQRSRVEAMLFLVDIYTSQDMQPAQAVDLGRELHQDYPTSPAMHLVLIGALGAAKEWDSMGQEADQFLKLAQSESPYYGKSCIPAGLYYTGLAALRQKNAQMCVDRMNELLAVPGLAPESRWLTFAYLRRGEAYDALLNRTKAVEDYERVLARPDVWDSRGEAGAHIHSASAGSTMKRRLS